MNDMYILSCSIEADYFTKRICNVLNVEQGKITRMKFKNDNNFVQINETVRAKDVYLIQTMQPPVNERIMELLITIDAVKRSSARSINVVLPYFPYSRSDKKDQPRIPVTAKLIAKLIEAAGATRVLTCDLHNQAIQAYFDINCDTITGQYLLEKYFENCKIENLTIVATDAGSSKKAYKYAEYFNAPMVLINKHRNGNTDTVEASSIIGEIKNRNAVIFDDEVDTAGSILEATRILKLNGVKDIFVGCTHGVLSGDAIKKIEESEIKEVVVTDTIPHINKTCKKIKIITITELFANAIKRIHENISIDDLFERQY